MLFINLPVYLVVLSIACGICGYIFWQIYARNLRRKVSRVDRRPAAAVVGGIRRRGVNDAAARRPAARMQRTGADVSDVEEDNDSDREALVRPNAGRHQVAHRASDDDESDHENPSSKKIGAKKASKLAEKERRKEEREAEERYRENQRKLEDKEIEKRKKAEEAEEQLTAAAAAAEAKLLAEEAAREQAEYELLKKSFAIEEEGTEAPQGGEQAEALLNASIAKAVKEAKVVPIEHLALDFGLKTESCVERLRLLFSSGQLTGLLDDRGKVIHITTEEYETVAQFIERRGRVTLSELVENGPNLLKLGSGDTRQ